MNAGHPRPGASPSRARRCSPPARDRYQVLPPRFKLFGGGPRGRRWCVAVRSRVFDSLNRGERVPVISVCACAEAAMIANPPFGYRRPAFEEIHAARLALRSRRPVLSAGGHVAERSCHHQASAGHDDLRSPWLRLGQDSRPLVIPGGYRRSARRATSGAFGDLAPVDAPVAARKTVLAHSCARRSTRFLSNLLGSGCDRQQGSSLGRTTLGAAGPRPRPGRRARVGQAPPPPSSARSSSAPPSSARAQGGQQQKMRHPSVRRVPPGARRMKTPRCSSMSASPPAPPPSDRGRSFFSSRGRKKTNVSQAGAPPPAPVPRPLA